MPANAMTNVLEDMVTDWGTMITNALLLHYPSNGAIPYINKYMKAGDINDAIAKAWDNGIMTTKDYTDKFEGAVSMIPLFSQMATPGASKLSTMDNPKVIPFKNELVKEYAGRMDDPTAVAEMQSKLVELDHEYLKDDYSKDFYTTPKLMRVARLRMGGMYGSEPDFDHESKIQVVIPSLSEGWTEDDLPLLINASRGGSYGRGEATALAGYIVKVTVRMFQNHKISQDDCGVKHGLANLPINELNHKSYVGRYIVGEKDPLTEDRLKGLIGKMIEIRSFTHCITPHVGVCKICVGDVVANSGLGIASHMMKLTSSFLGAFMSIVHTTELSVERYKYLDRIS